MITAIIISLYIIAIFVAYEKIKEWDNNEFEKVVFSIFWPLVIILYGIHWLHNKSLWAMKLVYNNIIPFKGYLAMCVFPFIFVRKDARELKTTDINHETIHGKQQIELLWVLFFVWYGIEWLVRWAAYGFDGRLAYRNISFEQEAYLNETDLSYPYERKLYAWLCFLFKKTYVRDAISRKIVKKQ